MFACRWTTHWFEVKCNIPEDWAGREVHFKWDSDSEAMASLFTFLLVMLIVLVFGTTGMD